MPGSTPYEEGVLKEHKWFGIWSEQAAEKKRRGEVREPSNWVIGPWRRPMYLPPVDAKATATTAQCDCKASSHGRHGARSERPLHSAATSAAPSKTRSVRSFSAPKFEKMRTSHSSTDFKRNFSLDASVLGPRFTPAYKPDRRMD